MKPIIGISGNHSIDKGGRFPGKKKAFVNDNYIQSVADAGGAPLILPVVYEEDIIDAQAEAIDGLILPGGQDVSAAFYQEEPAQKQGDIFPERDQFESLLLKKVLAKKKPVFAICRGTHIVNVTFGGTIYQDLSYIKKCYIKHDQYNNPTAATHSIDTEEGTLLRKLLGESHYVNSFHHQAIKDLAPGFRVAAMSKDGIIEAFEKEGDDYLLAVQFHPEMMSKISPAMLRLFEDHVHAALKRKQMRMTGAAG